MCEVFLYIWFLFVLCHLLQVKTESGSPLQLINEPNLQSSSTAGGGGGNLLATQTGATSISITKQPPMMMTTASSQNVIIKPPVIKDIGNSASAQAAAGSGMPGTPSLVVSVPLSSASGAAGLNLPAVNSASSSAGQNLFQQAIQNRGEHLNFSNAVSSRHSSSLNRASPIITGASSALPGGGVSQQQQQQQSDLSLMHHHHRQSPLVQSGHQQQLGVDNNGGAANRASKSPLMGGGLSAGSQLIGGEQQMDTSMLKVSYEKQQTSTIVSAPAISRLSAIQDEITTSGRRSRLVGLC